MSQKTWLKISVTAYFTSDEADFEKSASGDVLVGYDESVDWTRIMEKLVKRATESLGDDSPFTNVMLMSEEKIAAYLAALMLPEEVGKVVERLKVGAAEPCGGCCYGETMINAATLLQALAAENARLIEQCFALGAEIKALREEGDPMVRVPVITTSTTVKE